MKKVKTQIKNRVATKNAISIENKVALSVLMLSVFTLGLNFMGMLASPKLAKPVIDDPIISNLPLMVNDLGGASVNITVDGVENAQVEFITNFSDSGNSMGSLDLTSNRYYHSGSYGYQSGAPFTLQVFGDKAGSTIPARVINIETESGNKTLCFPESETLPWSGEELITYFYDINGTPYHDALLTKRATVKSCNQLLANKLDVDDLGGASVNITVDGVENAQVEFITNFSDSGNSMGSLDLTSNRYYHSGSYGYQSGAPFTLQVFGDKAGSTIPARVINIETESGNKTLCFPESETLPWSGEELITYFYDINGTPYHDALLTKRATCSMEVVAPVITSVLTASATVGTPFSYTITATNSPVSFGATGLPSGLLVNTVTGVISGTPSTIGTYSITISAINSSATDIEILTLVVEGLERVLINR